MPSRNIVKTYVEKGYYHIYNRGVAKQNIFNDSQDYKFFLCYIKEALSPSKKEEVSFSLRGRTFKALKRPVRNFNQTISLIAYCLMPNHFHLLLQQIEKRSMTSFMRSVITRYAKYFNKKYDRIGTICQGKFKAVLIENDRYLLHLSRYIHLNPSEYTKDITKAYSSYADYIYLRKTKWIKPDIVLKFFENPTIQEVQKVNNYKDFVEKFKKDSSDVLGELTLE
jgi:putative transposase